MTTLRIAVAQVVAVVLVAIALVADGTPVRATAGDRLDIRTVMLPQDDEEAARAAIRCELPDAGRCERVVARMLELPFAWHRTGYTFALVDVPPDDVVAATWNRPPAGVARRETREIELYFAALSDAATGELAAATSLRHLDRAVAHEVGHTFHQGCSERAVLRGWRSDRRIPDVVPDRGHAAGAHSSVAEDFAEAAMVWLLDGAYPSRSTVPSAPLTAGELEALAGTYFRSCLADD